MTPSSEYFYDQIIRVCQEAGCPPVVLEQIRGTVEQLLSGAEGNAGSHPEGQDPVEEALQMVEGFSRVLDRMERLEQEAVTDPLTGLFNRRQFLRQIDLETERARRVQEPYCVILVDVDHFKTVNDRHGHPEGDRVLCRVASVLRENFRRVDTVARYGGEEFSVLLPFTRVRSAATVTDRVRQEIRDNVLLPSGEPVTVSMGVASLDPRGGEMASDVVGQADEQLYRAKEEGRDRVCVRSDERVRPSTEITADERAGLFGRDR